MRSIECGVLDDGNCINCVYFNCSHQPAARSSQRPLSSFYRARGRPPRTSHDKISVNCNKMGTNTFLCSVWPLIHHFPSCRESSFNLNHHFRTIRRLASTQHTGAGVKALDQVSNKGWYYRVLSHTFFIPHNVIGGSLRLLLNTTRILNNLFVNDESSDHKCQNMSKLLSTHILHFASESTLTLTYNAYLFFI